MPDTIMTPGTYLRKRREAARISLDQVADGLAILPWRVRDVTTADVLLLRERIRAAEADRNCLAGPQAQLLRNVFSLDVAVYEALLLRHHAGPGCGLPEPQVCRTCACSWHDACLTNGASCSWTADPRLCSACAGPAAASAEVETEAAR